MLLLILFSLQNKLLLIFAFRFNMMTLGAIQKLRSANFGNFKPLALHPLPNAIVLSCELTKAWWDP